MKMKSLRCPLRSVIALVFLLSASSILPAAPWAVVADCTNSRLSVLDFGTTPATVYGSLVSNQLGSRDGAILDVAITPDGQNTSSKIKLPGTMPPPSTLSNSSTPVFVLATFWLCTSDRVVVIAGLRSDWFFESCCVGRVSGETVPHFPHSKHRPDHLAYWAPQPEHSKRILFCLFIIFKSFMKIQVILSNISQ